nr:MAG TPA: hypothetical protein [Caudoviricetes sp.]
MRISVRIKVVDIIPAESYCTIIRCNLMNRTSLCKPKKKEKLRFTLLLSCPSLDTQKKK